MVITSKKVWGGCTHWKTQVVWKTLSNVLLQQMVVMKWSNLCIDTIIFEPCKVSVELVTILSIQKWTEKKKHMGRSGLWKFEIISKALVTSLGITLEWCENVHEEDNIEK